MKNITIKNMIENSNIPASLIRSTIKQTGGFKRFKESAKDICNHGADCGFCGFTLYSDTVPFTRRNKKDLIEYMTQQIDDLEYKTILEFIASFRVLKYYNQDEIAQALYTGKSDAVTDVYNALAWYALEEVSRLYTDLESEA